jgi:hypothetical protein
MKYEVAAAFLLGLSAGVEGHGYITNPQPRAWTIPNHRFQPDPQSDGFAFQSCWDRPWAESDPANNQAGPIQVTWTENTIVEVDVRITAGHGGWHEVNSACL